MPSKRVMNRVITVIGDIDSESNKRKGSCLHS